VIAENPDVAPDKNFVASLQKGLEVLTCFDRLHPRLNVSDVARRTGTSPASARRALLTLQALGYLDGDGKHFWMLPKSLLVASAYLSSRPATSLAQPLLDALSERTRESASLAKLLDDHVIIIARSTARRSLSVGLGIGSRLPAYCSALGRMLLAALPPRVVREQVRGMKLEPLTPRTIVEPDQVIAQIAAARERGYSICDGELEIAVRSMAVPVFNRAGDAVAAMSIAVRADRASVSEMTENFLPALRRAQAHLARKLFHD
jgi:IclR family pca regulon transcriptional regulator